MNAGSIGGCRRRTPYNPARVGFAEPLRLTAAMTTQLDTNRLAVIDTDSGFITVLSKRLEGAG